MHEQTDREAGTVANYRSSLFTEAGIIQSPTRDICLQSRPQRLAAHAEAALEITNIKPPFISTLHRYGNSQG